MIPENPRRRQIAIFALIACCAMWGTSFPLVKALNQSIDGHFGATEQSASTLLRVVSSAWILAVRFSIAFLIFALVFRKTVRNATGMEHGVGALMAVFFFGGMMLQVCGLATIPASRSGFLTSLTVVLTPAATTLMLRRLPRWTVLAGVAVSAVGVAVLTGMVVIDSAGVRIADDALSRWTPGDTMTVASTFFFTAHVLLLDRFGRHHNPVAMTPAMFAVAAIAGWILFVSMRSIVPESDGGTVPWSPITQSVSFLVVMGLLCVFPSVISFVLMNKYQTDLTATQAAVIYTTEPVFVTLVAMFMPGMISLLGVIAYRNETLAIEHVVGGGLILLANVLALWPSRRATKSDRADESD